MDEQQEREVARGLREGETDAWQALYDAYAERVWHSVARRMGPDSADVADVVQETFLAAARSARTYDPARGSLWLWLSGIARRHVALHYRKRSRPGDPQKTDDRQAADFGRIIQWLEGRDDTPAEVLAAAELAGLVRAVLSELPADYEMLLTAKYLDGLPAEQIAAEQRCSPTAVRSKLTRARRAFRRALRKSVGFSSESPVRGQDES